MIRSFILLSEKKIENGLKNKESIKCIIIYK